MVSREIRGRVALLAGVLLVSGCSDEKPEEPPVAASSETPEPAYDGSLEPAAAVLALVPEDARTLTVTDFDQVRLELGAEGLSNESTPEELAAFWQRAEQERPMLTTGMLRPEEGRLGTAYGVTQVDVAWEAHFYDADDHEIGWVLRFRDGTDMAKVAAGDVGRGGVLSGAEVDAGEHLVSSGTTDDPAQSWAADPEAVAMVGLPANATYLARGCVADVGGGDVDELAVLRAPVRGQPGDGAAGRGPARPVHPDAAGCGRADVHAGVRRRRGRPADRADRLRDGRPGRGGAARPRAPAAVRDLRLGTPRRATPRGRAAS